MIDGPMKLLDPECPSVRDGNPQVRRIPHTPPPSPVRAMEKAPLTFAAMRAHFTFRAFPDVEMPSTTSPGPAYPHDCWAIRGRNRRRWPPPSRELLAAEDMAGRAPWSLSARAVPPGRRGSRRVPARRAGGASEEALMSSPTIWSLSAQLPPLPQTEACRPPKIGGPAHGQPRAPDP